MTETLVFRSFVLSGVWTGTTAECMVTLADLLLFCPRRGQPRCHVQYSEIIILWWFGHECLSVTLNLQPLSMPFQADQSSILRPRKRFVLNCCSSLEAFINKVMLLTICNWDKDMCCADLDYLCLLSLTDLSQGGRYILFCAQTLFIIIMAKVTLSAVVVDTLPSTHQ